MSAKGNGVTTVDWRQHTIRDSAIVGGKPILGVTRRTNNESARKRTLRIIKSSRHSKLTGDFAESLVLYWLSKYGFECARLDHTGIDLIANNPHTREVMGISVKGRCRNEGRDGGFVRIKKDEFKKVESACKAFGCVPYFAIVFDARDTIRVLLMSMRHIKRLSSSARTGSLWRMSKKAIASYSCDPEIMTVEFKSKTLSWWQCGRKRRA